MLTPSAAVIISHRIGLGTADPYVTGLNRLGYEVRVYCLGDFEGTARTLWSQASVQILGTASLSDPWWASIYSRAALAFSSLHPGLNPDQRPRWTNRSVLGRRVREMARWLLARVEPATLNRWLSASAAWSAPILEEDVLVVVTTSARPWLHAAGRRPTISIVESWDHPVRKTAAYRSDVVIAWNPDIGDDWVRIQGADAVFVGGPCKLAYAVEAQRSRDSLARSGRPRLMYAVGTSSVTPDWYQSEYRLIELVAEAADDAGWDMTLKLKPNGVRSDYVGLADRFSHVRLTDEMSSPNPMDYHLTDEYNQTRLDELAQADIMLNAVTTFALDAACAGVPVLQLAGFEGDDLAGIRRASRNYHLQKYLLNEPGQVMTVDSATMRSQLSAWLREPDSRAIDFSERVRAWLVPDKGMSVAVHEALTSALAEVGMPTVVSAKGNLNESSLPA